MHYAAQKPVDIGDVGLATTINVTSNATTHMKCLSLNQAEGSFFLLVKRWIKFCVYSFLTTCTDRSDSLAAFLHLNDFLADRYSSYL